MTYEAITRIEDGIYFLHPDGCGWIAVEFRGGERVGRTDQYQAGTHAAAGDRWDGVVPSVDYDIEVSPYEADMILEHVNTRCRPENVVVTRRGERDES